MVTIEPVMDFDIDVMVKWIEDIKPRMVWLGYDSKIPKDPEKQLKEPKLDKVRALYWELGIRGFTVMLKTIREGNTYTKKKSKKQGKVAVM